MVKPIGKFGSGKGSLFRDKVSWDSYGENYIRLFHPKCKVCGNSMSQRVGWFGKYYCNNKECKNYNKILKGN